MDMVRFNVMVVDDDESILEYFKNVFEESNLADRVDALTSLDGARELLLSGGKTGVRRSSSGRGPSRNHHLNRQNLLCRLYECLDTVS